MRLFPLPDPKRGDPALDVYVLEADAKAARIGSRGTGKMDLYRAGCFILEAKQGSSAGALIKGTARRDTPGWHIAMQDAYGQALGYARTVDAPPPSPSASSTPGPASTRRSSRR